jgi:hypothetical protein
MDSDEQNICTFLKTFPRQFVSAREICRRAGGKKRYRENPYWANQLLLRMTEKGIVEIDAAGHYRLRSAQADKSKEPKRWIAPQIEEMLRKSGKSFDGIIEINEDTQDPGM